MPLCWKYLEHTRQEVKVAGKHILVSVSWLRGRNLHRHGLAAPDFDCELWGIAERHPEPHFDDLD